MEKSVYSGEYLMNSLSLWIITSIVLFILTAEKVQSQSDNSCIVSISELIPAKFIDADVYYNPKDDIGNLALVFNEYWVEQNTKAGKYCRANFLRNATKKDMRNPKIQPALYYRGKDVRVSIDEGMFYHDDKIFTYKDEETKFANWLKIKATDYQNDEIAPRGLGTQCYIGAILPDKFRVVDLNQFKRIPVHLISYRSYRMLLSFGDSLLIGFVNNQSDLPIFKDPVLFQELTNYELPQDFIGISIVMEDFDHDDYKASSFPFYKINRIKSENNDLHLLLEKYNSTGEKSFVQF